jgi:pSer/pThr/pTyr-binding forkhead associated (FHA) protein
MTRPLRAPLRQHLHAPFLRYPGAPQPYLLQRTTRIGRAPENDIVLDDPLVSRRHAEITLVGSTATIRDVGSHNGTLLNGERVTEGQPLHDDDTIMLGTSQLTFHDAAEGFRPRLIEIGREAREVPIEKEINLGRADTNDVVLSSPGVSRRHAQIVVEKGDVILYDLASLNGTSVNGTLISGPYSLRDGDIISIDETEFRYRSELAAAVGT